MHSLGQPSRNEGAQAVLQWLGWRSCIPLPLTQGWCIAPPCASPFAAMVVTALREVLLLLLASRRRALPENCC